MIAGGFFRRLGSGSSRKETFQLFANCSLPSLPRFAYQNTLVQTADAQGRLTVSTLVFLITDQAPNNHPGHQNSGSSGGVAQIII